MKDRYGIKKNLKWGEGGGKMLVSESDLKWSSKSSKLQFPKYPQKNVVTKSAPLCIFVLKLHHIPSHL